MEFHENVIEWFTGGSVGITATEQKLKNRIIKLKAQYQDEVEIYENKDGSIFAHIPRSWVKINHPRVMTEEQRNEAAERLKLSLDMAKSDAISDENRSGDNLIG